MHFSHLVQDWFGQYGSGALHLPDGWFGRPYDNQYTLTSIEETAGRLTLILGDTLRLRFEGLKTIVPRTDELVLGPFENLHVEWDPADAAGNPESTFYQYGEARIIRTPD